MRNKSINPSLKNERLDNKNKINLELFNIEKYLDGLGCSKELSRDIIKMILLLPRTTDPDNLKNLAWFVFIIYQLHMFFCEELDSIYRIHPQYEDGYQNLL